MTTERDPLAPTELEVDQAFMPEALDDSTTGRTGIHFAEVAIDLSQKPGVSREVSAGLGINDTLWDGKRFPWSSSSSRP